MSDFITIILQPNYLATVLLQQALKPNNTTGFPESLVLIAATLLHKDSLDTNNPVGTSHWALHHDLSIKKLFLVLDCTSLLYREAG